MTTSTKVSVLGPIRRGLPPDALRCPVGTEPVIGRHVFAMGRMLAIAGGAGMGGHALPFKIYLYRARRDPHPQLLLQKLMRHRVIVAPDIDVIVEPGAALLPFGIDIGLDGQWLQRGFVEPLEQIPAAGTKMPGDLAVQLIQAAGGSRRSIHRGRRSAGSAAGPRSSARPAARPPRPLPCPWACAAAPARRRYRNAPPCRHRCG